MNAAYHDDALILRFETSTPEALLLQTADGYALPHFTHPPHFWQTCAPIHQALRNIYGLDTAILRCLHTKYIEGDTPAYHRLYAAELISGTLPENASFVALDTLNTLSIDTLYDLPALAGLYRADHPKRPAWAKPGWLPELQAKLNAAGIVLTAPVKHLRAWERGTVLKLPTTQGNLYLKAVPAFFAHEPALTSWLARRFPEHIPGIFELPGH